MSLIPDFVPDLDNDKYFKGQVEEIMKMHEAQDSVALLATIAGTLVKMSITLVEIRDSFSPEDDARR